MPATVKQLAELWSRPGQYGTTLLVLLLDTYGKEALDWNPVTIELELRDDYGIDIPEDSYDRLMTAVAVLTTDAFRSSAVDFARGCAVLSGHYGLQNGWVMPSCADIAWGITEAMLIDPPQEGDPDPFGPEIVGFVQKSLSREGILHPPDVLRIAGPNDLAARVAHEYANDLELRQGIDAAEAVKREQIQRTVADRLHGLMDQLQELPLTTGSTQFVAALKKRLPPSENPVGLAD